MYIYDLVVNPSAASCMAVVTYVGARARLSWVEGARGEVVLRHRKNNSIML
jgi:hypothetical protein